jgi:hypothetical protein
MAALGDGDVTPRPIWRVVGGMAVVRGHGVPEVLQGRGYSVSLSAMCAGGAAVLRVLYCCAMVSEDQRESETAKESLGAPCAVSQSNVFRVSASVVFGFSADGCGRLLSVGRSLDWESRKRIEGDVKGCRPRQENARPGSP